MGFDSVRTSYSSGSKQRNHAALTRSTVRTSQTFSYFSISGPHPLSHGFHILILRDEKIAVFVRIQNQTHKSSIDKTKKFIRFVEKKISVPIGRPQQICLFVKPNVVDVDAVARRFQINE